jgi:hypothetical protein|eukprot:COSAG01_NODE_9139_length_2540_cov_16.408029_2_plen_54_part_00
MISKGEVRSCHAVLFYSCLRRDLYSLSFRDDSFPIYGWYVLAFGSVTALCTRL